MTATPTPEKPTSESFFVKHKKLTITLAVILAFIITFASTLFIMVKIGEAKLRENLVAGEKLEATDNMDDNAIYHNGKTYYYNEDLINILLLGIDTKPNQTNTRAQADALYLVSADTKNSKVKIFSISRNTVCQFDVYSDDGTVYGTENAQICLAYAYGSNKINSSENCVKAVSNLLYNIPIGGYYTMQLSSISKIVNSVGGVKVLIPTNAPHPKWSDKAGQTLTLYGEDALSYISYRKDSNADRVENHKRFIKSFINSAKTAVKKDISLPLKIANTIKKDSTTNIDVSGMMYLATEALNWKLEFVNIKGEYSIRDGQEVYITDEEALKLTILDNFYIVK